MSASSAMFLFPQIKRAHPFECALFLTAAELPKEGWHQRQALRLVASMAVLHQPEQLVPVQALPAGLELAEPEPVQAVQELGPKVARLRAVAMPVQAVQGPLQALALAVPVLRVRQQVVRPTVPLVAQGRGLLPMVRHQPEQLVRHPQGHRLAR
jgi:hypothetical protein